MANSKMNQEFQKRMKQGVNSEEEQLRHIQNVRESMMQHKYSGMTTEKSQEGR